MTWIDMPAPPLLNPPAFITTTPPDTRAEVILARLVQEAERCSAVVLEVSTQHQVVAAADHANGDFLVYLPVECAFDEIVEQLYAALGTIRGRALR